MYKVTKGREIGFTKTAAIALLAIASLTQAGMAAYLDATFYPGSGPNGTVNAVVVDGDKVIIGGNFSSYNGTAVTNLARLNSNGTLDTTFQNISPDGAVYALALQTVSGATKILIGGQFVYIRRLNANGSIDKTFHVPTLNHYCTTVATDTAGGNNRIVIGGEFTNVDGYGRGRVARLAQDGWLDTYFDPYYGADATVWAVAADYRNRVIVGGAFSNLVTSVCSRIGRLTSSGTFDSTFTSSANASVDALAVTGTMEAGDYQVLVGGAFTTLSGASRDAVGRLNVWGGDPGTFTCSGANAQVLCGVIISGNYVIGGNFTTVNGVTRQHVAQIDNYYGCVTAWNPDITGGVVYAMSRYQYGGVNKLIVAGSFTTIEGSSYTRVARLSF